MRDIGREFQRVRSSSIVFSKGIWFSRTRSNSLGEKFIPRYLMLPDCSDVGMMLILWSVFSVWIPLMFTFCLIFAASGSMKMINIEGESGQPCLVPLCRLKLCEIRSFVLTRAFGELYNVSIQFIKDGPNPNLCRTANRNVQFTLSNAFSASKETTIFSNLLMEQ
uniref:Uncharacterized protein n=1 Tax=Pygocentrus nattereri TaxID=42514 RepID=A0AAR2KG78_PYGNA